MKKFFSEFKEFALKSNVLELAVAVIMGGAAGKMVSALVESILMPIVGIFMGGKDFSSLSYIVGDAKIQYGLFIQAAINFIITAFCIFLIMKAVKNISKNIHVEEEKKEKLPTEVDYLKAIKELLEANQRDAKD